MEQHGRSVRICLSPSPSVCCCRIAYKYSTRWDVCFGWFTYKLSALLPAAVPLLCVTAHDSFFSFFFSAFRVSLAFLTLFLWLLLFLFPLSRYSMSLPSSFCVSTPPSPPPLPFSPLPSWQRCQSGQADRGKHSTGQSRGRSKGWRIDYVYVCVLKCPLYVLSGVLVSVLVIRNCRSCECIVSVLWRFSLFVVHCVFDTVACVCVVGLCVSRRPSVTLCTDRRTHASRRGLWEGGVALRGCALLLSFPFFPPSRPSSPPVVRPSPPLTYRLQVFLLFYPATPLPVFPAVL